MVLILLVFRLLVSQSKIKVIVLVTGTKFQNFRYLENVHIICLNVV